VQSIVYLAQSVKRMAKDLSISPLGDEEQ